VVEDRAADHTTADDDRACPLGKHSARV
jgi:hypothetical protein